MFVIFIKVFTWVIFSGPKGLEASEVGACPVFTLKDKIFSSCRYRSSCIITIVFMIIKTNTFNQNLTELTEVTAETAMLWVWPHTLKCIIWLKVPLPEITVMSVSSFSFSKYQYCRYQFDYKTLWGNNKKPMGKRENYGEVKQNCMENCPKGKVKPSNHQHHHFQ